MLNKSLTLTFLLQALDAPQWAGVPLQSWVHFSPLAMAGA